jgi:hypothetical protein
MHNFARLSLASFTLLCTTLLTDISASAACYGRGCDSYGYSGYGVYYAGTFGLPYGYWGYYNGRYVWIRYGCFRRGIDRTGDRRGGWVTYCW